MLNKDTHFINSVTQKLFSPPLHFCQSLHPAPFALLLVPTWCLFFLMSLNSRHLALFRNPYLILWCSMTQNSWKMKTFRKKDLRWSAWCSTQGLKQTRYALHQVLFSSQQMKTAVQMERDKSWGRSRQNEGHCVQTGSATSHRSYRLISVSDISHRRTN